LEQKHQKKRIPLAEAQAVADQLCTALLNTGAFVKIEALGSLRRQAPTVGDVDLGAVVKSVEQARQSIRQLPMIKSVLAAGDNMIRIVLRNSWQVDIKLSSAEEWGSFMQHFTGSKEHNIRLREYALKRGLSLSEHGIIIKSSGEVKKFTSEEAFYTFLDLRWIPPAERVGGNEIEKYHQ
jgi:DNA polymerase (family 10)